MRQNLLDNWINKIKEKHNLFIDWAKLDNIIEKLKSENLKTEKKEVESKGLKKTKSKK